MAILVIVRPDHFRQDHIIYGKIDGTFWSEERLSQLLLSTTSAYLAEVPCTPVSQTRPHYSDGKKKKAVWFARQISWPPAQYQ